MNKRSLAGHIFVPVLLALYFEAAAFAQVVLFQNGQQVENYNQLILALEPGQTVQFSNGETYPVREILGHGNTTLIISDGATARRIPLWRGHRGLVVAEGQPNPYDLTRIKREGQTVDNWLGPDPAKSALPYDGRFSAIHEEFGNSQREMEIAGVKVLPINWEKSVPGEFWEVPRVEVVQTLDQFIEQIPTLPEAQVKQRLELLDPLIRSTYKCAVVGDFSPRQIAFLGDRWVLLDHRGGVIPAIQAGGQTAVQGWKRIAPDNPQWQEYVARANYDIIKARVDSDGAYTDIQIPIAQFRDEMGSIRETDPGTNPGQSRRGDPSCDILQQSYRQFF